MNGDARGKREHGWRPVEETNWERYAGPPTAADSAGPYTIDQLLKMDADFVAAVTRAIA